jgi:hypothetical protein
VSAVSLLLMASGASTLRHFEALVVLLVGMLLGAFLLAWVWKSVIRRSPSAIWGYALNFMWQLDKLRPWLRADKRGLRCPSCAHTEIMHPDGSPDDIVEI